MFALCYKDKKEMYMLSTMRKVVSLDFFHYLVEAVLMHLSFIKIIICNQSMHSWSSN